LSDRNSGLITAFRAVRDRPSALIKALGKFDYDEDLYYGIRDSPPENKLDEAARFIFINRCAWNGLYRVDSYGHFNVPFGSRERPPAICDPVAINAASFALQGAELRTVDFSVALGRVDEGDFVFADPPYVTAHKDNGFVMYNERIFSWSDQLRLQRSLLGVHQRGGLFLLTNADHPSIWQLYAGFIRKRVSRTSILAADARYRGRVTELVISNYAVH
jgi:DNA adenine methylase